jgi:hypothetical protein
MFASSLVEVRAFDASLFEANLFVASLFVASLFEANRLVVCAACDLRGAIVNDASSGTSKANIKISFLNCLMIFIP